MNHRMRCSPVVAAILAALLLTLSACGSPKNPDYAESPAEPGVTGDAADQVTREDISGGIDASLPSAVPEGPKIIRGGYITAKTDHSDESYQTLLQWVLERNGYESNQSFWRQDENLPWGRSNTIETTLHIPATELDAFLALVRETVTVTSQSFYRSDITAQYADVALREKTQRESLAAYYRLLKEAKTVADILAVQRAIDELTLEIESQRTMLNAWNQQLEFSEVSLTLQEPVPFSFLAVYFWQIFFVVAGIITLIFVLADRSSYKKFCAQMASRNNSPAAVWYAGPAAAPNLVTVPPQPGVSPQSGRQTDAAVPTPPAGATPSEGSPNETNGAG